MIPLSKKDPDSLGLSKKELKVLFGLTHYPDLSDNEIIEKTGIKRSTFNLAKKKLKTQDYYKTVRIPIPQHLGCTFFNFSFLYLNRNKMIKEHLNAHDEDSFTYFDEVCIFTEASHSIKIAIVKSMTDFERNFSSFIRHYETNRFLGEKGITTIRFPFELTSIHTFLSFGPLLNRVFDLGFADAEKGAVKSAGKTCVVKDSKLNLLEKKIFYHLIKYPEGSDQNIAEKIGCSRTSVTKAKDRFQSEDLMRKKRMVNLDMLGFKILSFTHAKLNPQSPRKIHKGFEYTAKIKTPILQMTKDFDLVSITPFTNFQEYHELHEKTTNYYAKNGLIIGEPTTILMSIPRMNIVRSQFYAPFIKKIFEL